MLGKFLKYECKSYFKFFGLLCLVTLLISITSFGLSFLPKSISIIEYIRGIFGLLSGSIIIGLPFIAFFLVIRHYYINCVKDEAYLIHTLPISKNTFLLSNIISAIIVGFVAICLSFICALLAFRININDVFKFINNVSSVLTQDILLTVLLVLTVILGAISNIVMIYAAISLGQKHNNKLAYSFGYYIAIYYATQFIATIFLLIPGFFITDYFNSFLSNSFSNEFSIIKVILAFSLVLNIIIFVVCYMISKKTLEKRLNLN